MIMSEELAEKLLLVGGLVSGLITFIILESYLLINKKTICIPFDYNEDWGFPDFLSANLFMLLISSFTGLIGGGVTIIVSDLIILFKDNIKIGCVIVVSILALVGIKYLLFKILKR